MNSLYLQDYGSIRLLKMDDIENEELVPPTVADNIQYLDTDPEFLQVVYGYKKSRCRKILVNIFSVLLIGFPFLLFHWLPRWRLYLTSIRSPFHEADTILVVETYQKKWKSFYIHPILVKEVAESIGISNDGYQPENDGENMEEDDGVAAVHLVDGTKLMVHQYRYFVHKKCVLLWDDGRALWLTLAGIECGTLCSELHRTPQTTASRNKMLNLYGMNEILVPVQSVMTLVLLEVFNPFYVFQIFTIAVWLAEEYYYYCIAIVLMSTFGVTTSVIQTKRNQLALRATVELSEPVELLRRDGSTSVVDSRYVAPGDIVVIPANGCRLHFDAVLLDGAAIVNESMLTGESVPVTKTALLRIDKSYDNKEHASHTLYCGTQVLQTRFISGEHVRALVIRTGYDTSKGQLVRSILYPIPADFKFDRDSYKFIIILTGLSIIGLAYTIALKAYRGITAGDIIIKALDILTIVIPPALPAAMTVGRLYAVSRLKKQRVSCLNTRAVNVSGSLDCICFDKTGTLTEDGMDMWGVVPMTPGLVPATPARPLRDPRQLRDLDDLKIGMATCHSLALIDDKLQGDPLDLKMFESIDWELQVPEVPQDSNLELVAPTIVKPRNQTNINVENFHMPLEVGVVVQYQFVSSLQRASVVARVLGEEPYRVYCKGAPEMIRTLCRTETVPSNLDVLLSSYAEKGYRVIAMSTRILETSYSELQKMTREEVERDLDFLGLVILENRLKPTTAGVIAELKQANINVVMITGDNIHTAVSVAKECGILAAGERVVHLYVSETDKVPLVYCENTLHGVRVGSSSKLSQSASVDSGVVSWGSSDTSPETGAPMTPNYKVVLTGDTWKVLREHYSSLVPRIIERGAVFARMTSDQKQQLIVEYQALGYYVGMCGDGANDCGALRAAHCGVSLSELESSVAAPFTAQDLGPAAVTRVLKEGRAALTTSFGVFKFMVAYSLTEFFSVAFLYYFDSNLTDFQFLYVDLALIVNFAFFFGKTDAYAGKLCKRPPLTSLLGIVPLFSLIGQMLLIAAVQFLSYFAIKQFPWYVRHTFEGDDKYACYENYAVFAVSMFQYIILAIVFSHGAPYRKSVITNYQFMISVVIMTAISAYIAITPAQWLAGFLELKMPDDLLMCYIVILLACINFVVALFFERVVVEYMMEKKMVIPRFVTEKRVRKTPHLMIKRQLTDNDYLTDENVVRYDPETNGRVNGFDNHETGR